MARSILKTHRCEVLKLVNLEQLEEAKAAHSAHAAREHELAKRSGYKMHGSIARSLASWGRALAWREGTLQRLTAQMPARVIRAASHDPELHLAWRARCDAYAALRDLDVHRDGVDAIVAASDKATELGRAYRKLKNSRRRSGLLFSQA